MSSDNAENDAVTKDSTDNLTFDRSAVPWKYYAGTYLLYALFVSGVVGLILTSTTPRTGIVVYLGTVGGYAVLLVFRLFQVIVQMMKAGFQGQTRGENAPSEGK